MFTWLLGMFLAALALWAADRVWLRHVARTDLPLHDPDGFIELTARIAELCHGDHAQAGRLIDAQKALHPQIAHGEAVRRAMQQLLAPAHH